MQIVEQNMQTLVEKKITYQYVEQGARISDTSGGGDMLKAVYDPNTVEADAFDMDNMSESATAKILTQTERSNITTNNAKVSFPEAPEDSKQYARKDAAWDEVTATGGGAIDYANPVSVTGAASIPSTNKFKNHVCAGTTANYTLNLPTTGLTSGDLFAFEMSAALTELVTLDALAGQLIDGQQTRIMWAKEKAVLKWDGVNWQKISGLSTPMTATMSRQLGTPQSILAGVTNKTIMDTLVTNTGFLTLAASQIIIPRPGLWSMNGFWAMFKEATAADGSASLISFGINTTAFPDDPAGVGGTIPFTAPIGSLFGYVGAGYTFQGEELDTVELVSYTDQSGGVDIRLGGAVAATLAIVEVISW